MTQWAMPIARIILRYGIGFLAGSEIGEMLALDDDAVMMLALALAAGVEAAYVMAKRKGGAT